MVDWSNFLYFFTNRKDLNSRSDSDCRTVNDRLHRYTLTFTQMFILTLVKPLNTQRSEPSSRTTLIGEQPNLWELLHPQDVVSRHRGAELRRRYELLGGTSLLSLE